MIKLLSRYLVILLIIFSTLLLFYSSAHLVSADELDEINKKIEELKKARQMSVDATAPLVTQLQNIEKTLAEVEAKLNAVSIGIQRKKSELNELEKKITESENLLAFQKEVLKKRVRVLYIRSTLGSPFLVFFSRGSAADITRELAIRKAASLEDKRVIATISAQLRGLSEDREKAEKLKTSLEAEQAKLTVSQKEYDEQAVFFRKEIAGARVYQEQLEKKIAELTARQQAILAARSGVFTTSVGEVPVSSIPCSGPPGSPVYCDPGPGNWFAAFSFGAWTHRKGMSQYGAKGRAETGAGYHDILQAYYGGSCKCIGINKVDTGGTISVAGIGDLDFEGYYLLGIAEMPSNWPKEALKAQAVAARSYAYRYKQEGKTICTTQACQVFLQSKANEPPPEWRQAVEETKGEVVEGVIAYYSSTAGGYLETMGWDTTDGQGGPGFASRAWESKAGSPWFYSGWFTESYRPDSSKCGRSHPWLSEEEVADILNAWVVRRNGSDEDLKRVLPVTIDSCPVTSIGGGDPYSIEELRQKAAQLGESFTAVSSVSVSYSNDGSTASVTFQTNRGSITIPGSEFMEAFNLRAPGFIAIRSPLFNIEKK